MQKRSIFSAMGLSIMAMILFLGTASAMNQCVSTNKKLQQALDVMKAIQSIPENGIPRGLLKKCRALAIFPSVYKGGFIIGGSYGKGVIFAKDPKTGQWYGPAFLAVGAGSIGWQLGVKATDLVLVIMNDRGLSPFFRRNLTLGGEISVAAGPVGREFDASTDVLLKSEIYAYSRSRGFFAGVSLEGAYIYHDYDEDAAFWGKSYTPMEILTGMSATENKAALALLSYLEAISR